MKRTICSLLLTVFALTLLSGCCCFKGKKQEFPHAVVTKISKPIVIDGILDDEAWNMTPEYELGQIVNRCKDVPREDAAMLAAADKYETGYVRYAYDDKYLYVGIKFMDSEIYSECTENQKMLITFGETAEVFIKPKNAYHYWELYVGPYGNQSTFFYPCNGYLGIPSCWATNMEGMKTAAKVYGTINNRTDIDDCWTAEMAIPLEFFAKEGIPFEPGQEWSIMTARYNPSATRPYRQYSSYPKMPVLSYHLIECYGPVDFK